MCGKIHEWRLNDASVPLYRLIFALWMRECASTCVFERNSTACVVECGENRSILCRSPVREDRKGKLQCEIV